VTLSATKAEGVRHRLHGDDVALGELSVATLLDTLRSA
jgi:hypothetical protein